MGAVVAVITGAGSGIGAGLARYASGLGMTAVLADVNGDAVAALRDELSAAAEVAHDVVCDVRHPDAVQDIADRAYRDVGPVRLFGEQRRRRTVRLLSDAPVPNWQRIVDVNVSGVFSACARFCRR